PAVDLAAISSRREQVVSGLAKGVEYLFRKHRIEWIRGTARLGGAGDVDVLGDAPRTLSAREVIVATGSAPRPLAEVPVDGTRVITSDEAIALPSIPASIAIIGSGAVGVEFASIFNRFGSRVTLIETMPVIVPGEDAAVSAELARAFRRRGIDIRTTTRVTGAEVTDDGVRLSLERRDGQAGTLDVERVLVAVGRRPVTDGLGA